MNTRSSSSSASSPSQATAFGAFLVALRAIVVTVTARALPPGSGFSFARIQIEPTSRHRETSRLQRWAKDTRARVSAALRMLGHEPDFAVDFDVEPGAGAVLDVAILAACIGAVGRIGSAALADTLFVGALGFPDADKIVGVRGVLPMLRSAEIRRGVRFPRALVPSANRDEACRADVDKIFSTSTISDLIEPDGAFAGLRALDQEDVKKFWRPQYPKGLLSMLVEILDARTVRALVIAAAGGHGIRLVGRHPRTLDAARLLRGLLPLMTESEAVETSAIWSAAGIQDSGDSALDSTFAGGLLRVRPFRAPHHTVGGENSLGAGRTHGQAYVGGGDPIYLGEASLAHNGVLFLGEAEQIHPIALDRLADVLAHGDARFWRKDSTETIPASPCNLVISVPPCACAYDPSRASKIHPRSCAPEKVAELRDRPLRKLRPFVDVSVEIGERPDGEKPPRIDELRATVERAWDFTVRCPRELTEPPLGKVAQIACTIADIDGSEDVFPRHVEEARLFALGEIAS